MGICRFIDHKLRVTENPAKYYAKDRIVQRPWNSIQGARRILGIFNNNVRDNEVTMKIDGADVAMDEEIEASDSHSMPSASSVSTRIVGNSEDDQNNNVGDNEGMGNYTNYRRSEDSNANVNSSNAVDMDDNEDDFVISDETNTPNKAFDHGAVSPVEVENKNVTMYDNENSDDNKNQIFQCSMKRAMKPVDYYMCLDGIDKHQVKDVLQSYGNDLLEEYKSCCEPKMWIEHLEEDSRSDEVLFAAGLHCILFRSNTGAVLSLTTEHFIQGIQSCNCVNKGVCFSNTNADPPIYSFDVDKDEGMGRKDSEPVCTRLAFGMNSLKHAMLKAKLEEGVSRIYIPFFLRDTERWGTLVLDRNTDKQVNVMWGDSTFSKPPKGLLDRFISQWRRCVPLEHMLSKVT